MCFAMLQERDPAALKVQGDAIARLASETAAALRAAANPRAVERFEPGRLRPAPATLFCPPAGEFLGLTCNSTRLIVSVLYVSVLLAEGVS